ncbi:protein MULTIPLE CHLOROPLAST DIVISION SITE 1 isoform X2 [Amborella trichopoda]|uniref:Protein MULTIPLE CHLOROPLAST DIVISION SITE 1 n=1 Tax=Amborella trichopoda TaxID=13333 RepID=U5D4I3_AMBTC|nr:protein MULTIPLE CHLOROPLAST DIVISION SITE 1 isoform X2 [Amborella trichopoda]ERN17115.1 hypothetical protein AMTR_s00044p00111620 [Amborella trichopoda]|eukprot:XP_006855648.1 protein MULTIPLE CHLOROPLAST DIVISION SITE 1 isoform X2 [Amborella trichopoda]
MASISTVISLLHRSSSFSSPGACDHGNSWRFLGKYRYSCFEQRMGFVGWKYRAKYFSELVCIGRRCHKWNLGFFVRASGDISRPDDNQNREPWKRALTESKVIEALQGVINNMPPPNWKLKSGITMDAIGLGVLITIIVNILRAFLVMKVGSKHRGSVADLVKRGQIRSDRRGISKPLIYDDPFNNPLVRVGKGNSTVNMFGKVYRLAPVTLTTEQQKSHQKRRMRAYQWKRPTLFLKEGEPIPPDVDPDTVRWIPANHPFATTVNDIDEDLAQKNVNQKHGVPFRIKAEHEALQRKLEMLQNEQKLNSMTIETGSIRELERPFKPSGRLQEQQEQSLIDNPSPDNLNPEEPQSTFENRTSPTNSTKELLP